MSDENEFPTSGGEEQEQVNPFVPMHTGAIWTVLFLGGAYTLIVCSMALFNSGRGGISMVGVAISSAWLILCTLYPFISYKPAYGWCHPLILLSFLGMANLVPRSTSLFMNGLSEHIMLPDWSTADLNWLFAYGNIVNS